MTESRKNVWREVAYIGTMIGEHGGKVWRLVLDGCGHTVHRKQRRPRVFVPLEKVLAPKRVICMSCMFGHPPLDVDGAIAFAMKLDQTGSREGLDT